MRTNLKPPNFKPPKKIVIAAAVILLLIMITSIGSDVSFESDYDFSFLDFNDFVKPWLLGILSVIAAFIVAFSIYSGTTSKKKRVELKEDTDDAKKELNALLKEQELTNGNKPNYALAELNFENGDVFYYIATSGYFKLSEATRIKRSDELSIKYGKKIIIAQITDIEPEIPLQVMTDNLGFVNVYEKGQEEYKQTFIDNGYELLPNPVLDSFKNGYDARRKNCTERKILNQIVKDFKNQSTYKLDEATLYMYTKLIPCSTCYGLLSVEKNNKRFKDLKIFYDDMSTIEDEHVQSDQIFDDIDNKIEELQEKKNDSNINP